LQQLIALRLCKASKRRLLCLKAKAGAARRLKGSGDEAGVARMTMVHGQALRMRYQLAQLRRQHQVTPAAHVIPLAPASDCPMIVEGIAAHTDTDLDRCKFRAYAFTLLPWAKPPPLYCQHNTDRTVGTIDHLSYNSKGNLCIRATVTDPHAARMGGLSVALVSSTGK
jgi:hypothetical protein